MQKRNKLAAIVNCLSEDELANLSSHAALSLLQALRKQPPNPDVGRALTRLTTHLLDVSPFDADEDPPCVPLLH